MTREFTTKFIEAMDEGRINPKVLAENLLGYMSEREVEDFAMSEGYFDHEEEEEEETIMDFLTLDINYDMFKETDLVLGRDVTDYFAEDWTPPVKAVIVNPKGPGGGNPIVKFTFQDSDHSCEWFSHNGAGSGESDVEEYQAAQESAA